jgi:CNT family concentrative nucleoside transporter
MADILPAVDGGPQKRLSTSSSSDVEKVGVERTNALGENDKEEGARERAFNKNLRVLFLVGIAALILGWWISSTVLKATRDKWVVQTIFAWFFLTVIAFRFIPNSVVTRPVAAVWVPFVQEPWYRLPRNLRLTIGWLCLLGIIFGSAFGFPLAVDDDYGHRAISVLGLFVFQCCFFLSSTNRPAICWCALRF